MGYIRLGKAWGALNNMDKIWKSNLPDSLKRNFFRATVESVHVYGSVSWTLTAQLEKKLDGAYTRMLRAALSAPRPRAPEKDITNKTMERIENPLTLHVQNRTRLAVSA